MKIISFQSRRIATALEAGQSVVTRPLDRGATWCAAFSWMRREMISRRGAPPIDAAPLSCPPLLWGWPAAHEPPAETVKNESDRSLHRIEMDLPGDTVLLSDFNAWHLVLAGDFIARNARENEDFSHRWQRKGLDADLYREIEQSWHHIFDMKDACPDYWGDPSDRIWQAVFWQPPSETIRRVTPVF